MKRSENQKASFGEIIDLLLGKNLKAKDSEFITPKSFDEKTAAYYDKNIKPLLKDVELNRINTLKYHRLNLIISIPVILLSVFIFWIFLTKTSMDLKTGLFISITPYIAFTYLRYKRSYKHNKASKGKILSKFLGLFGEYSYESVGTYPVDELDKFGIIPKHYGVTISEHIKGNYKNVIVDTMRARLDQTKSSAFVNKQFVNSFVLPAFNGIFIVLDFERRFQGKTIIIQSEKTLEKTVSKSISDLEEINTNYTDFKVYSEKVIEAKYLTTKELISTLLKLKNSFPVSTGNNKYSLGKVRGLQASFYENKLFIMVPTNKEFYVPASIFKTNTFEDEINTLTAHMKIVFEIIDALS